MVSAAELQTFDKEPSRLFICTLNPCWSFRQSTLVDGVTRARVTAASISDMGLKNRESNNNFAPK